MNRSASPRSYQYCPQIIIFNLTLSHWRVTKGIFRLLLTTIHLQLEKRVTADLHFTYSNRLSEQLSTHASKSHSGFISVFSRSTQLCTVNILKNFTAIKQTYLLFKEISKTRGRLIAVVGPSSSCANIALK